MPDVLPELENDSLVLVVETIWPNVFATAVAWSLIKMRLFRRSLAFKYGKVGGR
ncbi:hypothetical protein RGR602_PC02065 (plasmid) [Rhizobium gallicum bv. gallicum R602sp]|uniref:Uncharacterized protein n=1 Tax=Rhizobium gallicum bv. gallicum R602sp TaxID=1041138 RepID=A0A0B4XHM4_9HYPH|nr:hypothetical protein RGR602_PC02065 [Rhizobium gallicum bv. gallicum R602sp]